MHLYQMAISIFYFLAFDPALQKAPFTSRISYPLFQGALDLPPAAVPVEVRSTWVKSFLTTQVSTVFFVCLFCAVCSLLCFSN